MNTTLARRQRHRRNGSGRRGGGHSARTVVIALPLFLFGTFVLLGVVGLVAIVGAYNVYSQGLPDPLQAFQNLSFSEQTVVYDRTGKVELARFGSTQRQVVGSFSVLPPVVVDATTSTEDKTFWSNAGFDPLGIVAAAIETATGRDRGASTITQQLVRARLLPASAFAGSVYERKIREIIQSIRLTQEFPGVEGKQRMLVAYLNQNYYGDQSYGIAAAARDYFGVTDLNKLTIAEAAILAAIPQSPSTYDLRKNAVQQTSPDGKTTFLVVPTDAPIVVRRNAILERMIASRHLTLAGDPLAVPTALLTDAQIRAAETDPVILAPTANPDWRAPHFVWQVRKQLGTILCGAANADNCPAIDTAGYQVTTTLNWKMQQSAEKWVKGAGIAPNAPNPTAYLKAHNIPNQQWIQDLVGRGIYNAALEALDYRTGQVDAYVGSADYYAPPHGTKFQPQFDALSDGWRQPGSAFKLVNYITGIDDHTMTAASMFMDVVTDFGGNYLPTDADLAERGPVRMRQAIQLSINIPAIKNAIEVGTDRVFAEAQKFGIHFQRPTNTAGASIGIGTLELHYADLLGAYGAVANGGVLMPRTFILQVRDGAGKLIYPAPGSVPATGSPIVSPQSAYIMTSILSSNTDPSQNPWWGLRAIYDKGVRRPATLKTGTTNNEIDNAAFGYLAPPKDPNAPALAVGAWMGNSDNSIPPNGTLALESAATLWQAFLTEVTKGTPIADFQQPPGIVDVAVDANSGMLPGPFTTRTFTEHFIAGTQPTQVDDTKVAVAIDSATGLLWTDGCTGPQVQKGFLDLSNQDAAFPAWQAADQAWIARARKGPGVRGGPMGNVTAYWGFGSILPFGATWGAPFAPTETCTPTFPSPSPSCDPIFGCPSPSVPPSGAPTAPPPSQPVVTQQPSRRPLPRRPVRRRRRRATIRAG
ncbi:MAG: transglycosylase domain-containing protein [Candidatus Limnocylindrales bacterium]